MGFFQKSLSAEERQAALRYLEGSLEVSAFHEKEADRYNDEATRFQNSSQDAAHLAALIQAAERLVSASEEALRRHASLESQAPPVAAAAFSSWLAVYDLTVKWSNANHEALLLVSSGGDPSSTNVVSRRNVVSIFEDIAERKSKDFLKRVQLTQADYDGLLSAARKAMDQEHWSPE